MFLQKVLCFALVIICVTGKHEITDGMIRDLLLDVAKSSYKDMGHIFEDHTTKPDHWEPSNAGSLIRNMLFETLLKTN